MSNESAGSATQRLTEDALESREWWKSEALRYERQWERTFLLMGLALVITAPLCFWMGVLIG